MTFWHISTFVRALPPHLLTLFPSSTKKPSGSLPTTLESFMPAYTLHHLRSWESLLIFKAPVFIESITPSITLHDLWVWVYLYLNRRAHRSKNGKALQCEDSRNVHRERVAAWAALEALEHVVVRFLILCSVGNGSKGRGLLSCLTITLHAPWCLLYLIGNRFRK